LRTVLEGPFINSGIGGFAADRTATPEVLLHCVRPARKIADFQGRTFFPRSGQTHEPQFMRLP
jgi:hypothetical protein